MTFDPVETNKRLKRREKAKAVEKEFAYMRADNLARYLVDRFGDDAPKWAQKRAASRGYLPAGEETP